MSDFITTGGDTLLFFLISSGFLLDHLLSLKVWLGANFCHVYQRIVYLVFYSWDQHCPLWLFPVVNSFFSPDIPAYFQVKTVEHALRN